MFEQLNDQLLVNFLNFEEVLANNCGYFKIHNTGLLWKKKKAASKRISSQFECHRQNIRNLFVADFWKCWLPARCTTVWSFLFQIHLFKKEKKLSFVCWQHKSSKAIHNEVKSSMKLHLNFYHHLLTISWFFKNVYYF